MSLTAAYAPMGYAQASVKAEKDIDTPDHNPVTLFLWYDTSSYDRWTMMAVGYHGDTRVQNTGNVSAEVMVGAEEGIVPELQRSVLLGYDRALDRLESSYPT